MRKNILFIIITMAATAAMLTPVFAALSPQTSFEPAGSAMAISMVLYGDKVYVGEKYAGYGGVSLGRISIYDTNGAFQGQFTTWTNTVYEDGSRLSVIPYGIFVDGSGIFVLGDMHIMRYGEDGSILMDRGLKEIFGIPMIGVAYNPPSGIAGDGTYLYVGDTYGNRVLKLDYNTVYIAKCNNVPATEKITLRKDIVFASESRPVKRDGVTHIMTNGVKWLGDIGMDVRCSAGDYLLITGSYNGSDPNSTIGIVDGSNTIVRIVQLPISYPYAIEEVSYSNGKVAVLLKDAWTGGNARPVIEVYDFNALMESGYIPTPTPTLRPLPSPSMKPSPSIGFTIIPSAPAFSPTPTPTPTVIVVTPTPKPTGQVCLGPMGIILVPILTLLGIQL